MLSEHMSYEHALTYALCLSKSVNSVNQVMQFLQDKENQINSLKFMDSVRWLLPDEVSPMPIPLFINKSYRFALGTSSE